MKTVLQASAAAALLSLCVFLAFLGLEIDKTRVQLDQRVAAVQHDISLTLDGDPNSGTSAGMMPLRERLVLELHDDSDALRGDARTMFGDLRRDTFRSIHDDVIPPVYAALGIANRTRGDAVRAMDGIRSDLAPTLAGSAAIVKDAQDSWDDLYPDVKAAVGSATVATTSAAQAAEAVRDVAPKMANATAGTAVQVNGIARDIHTATTDFVKPRTFWQHLKMWAEVGGRLAIRLL